MRHWYRGQPVEHLDEDLADNVLSILDVAEAGQRVTVDLVDVGVVEGAERVKIAGPGSLDNLTLGFPVSAGVGLRRRLSSSCYREVENEPIVSRLYVAVQPGRISESH